MEEALRTRRRVYIVGAVAAVAIWALIYAVGSRLDGPLVDVPVESELVLALAGGFCLLSALFVLSMKPKLADQIIDQGREREAAGGAELTLRTMGRQLSLMGAGLGWSVLTAGYVAVMLTGLYQTFGAFLLTAILVSAAAGSRIRRLLAYAQQMGVD